MQLSRAAFALNVEIVRTLMKLKLVILAALIEITWCCGNSAGAEIKIGVAAALTGNAAQYGTPIRKGFELAAAQINDNGGINGNRLELIFEDEQGKKEVARQRTGLSAR